MSPPSPTVPTNYVQRVQETLWGLNAIVSGCYGWQPSTEELLAAGFRPELEYWLSESLTKLREKFPLPEEPE